MDLEQAVYDTITLSTVGFLGRPKGARWFEPCGSGILVDIGGVRGIATAAHVIQKRLKKYPELALFTIVKKDRPARSLQFSPQEIEFVLAGGDEESADGPDLAFLQVPMRIHEHLEAENIFHSFKKSYAAAAKSEAPLVGNILAGVLAEGSDYWEVADGLRSSHKMVFGAGEISNERTVNGFQLFDFVIDHNEDLARPATYGGLSGSAVWRTGEKDVRADRLLYGIVYWETLPNDEGVRTIICHGPESLYGLLIDMVRERFPAQFKGL